MISGIENTSVEVNLIIMEYLCSSGCELQFKFYRTDVYNWLKAQPKLYVELKQNQVWQDRFMLEAYEDYFQEQIKILIDRFDNRFDDYVDYVEEFILPYLN